VSDMRLPEVRTTGEIPRSKRGTLTFVMGFMASKTVRVTGNTIRKVMYTVQGNYH